MHAKMIVQTLSYRWCLAALGAIFLAGCDRSKPEELEAESRDFRPPEFVFQPRKQGSVVTAANVVRFPVFGDVADSVGISHVFNNGASPRAIMIESTGGGSGWFDYDHDGIIDLCLTQGGILCPAPDVIAEADLLLRQRPGGQFVNCFAEAGLSDRGFGHGVAAADFDNDGFDDLFVANAGQNRLFLNNGDGTFRDGTSRMIGDRPVWSSTAAWADPDCDGDLDLYVCNYAIYDACNPVECLDKEGIASICHPRMVESEPDFFFLNEGNGLLRECAAELGLKGPGNKALGVVIADLTADGVPDIYVANDTTANFLFLRQADGTYTNAAPSLGGAFNATGEPQASMGIGFGDYDGNGLPDLLLTHFSGESNTLYQNRGAQGFVDVSGLTGLREATLPKLGFGTVMEDFNLDGQMDLFVVNGHIDPRYAEAEGYEMKPQLFSFDDVRWQECPEQTNAVLGVPRVGRSVSSADFDSDGDLDLCVVYHNTPTLLLQNQSECGKHLQIRLLGRQASRSALNCRVTVETGGSGIEREIVAGTSYAACHERVLFIALPEDAETATVSVHWCGGETQVFEVSASSVPLLFVEGLAKPLEI